MATLCGLSEFSTDSQDLAGTTYDIVFTDSGSGITFQPVVTLFYWGGGIPTFDFLSRANMNSGRGYAISPTERAAIGALNVNGVGTSNAKRVHLTDTVFFQIDTVSNVTKGRLDLNGLNVDGIQLIVDESFSVNGMHFNMLGLAGDLNAAAIIQAIMADDACASTPRDFVGFGFDPAFGMGIGMGDADLKVTDFESRNNHGVFLSGAQQGAWGQSSDDGAATSATARYSRFGDIGLVRLTDSGSVRVRQSLNALITDGFRFDCLEDDDDRYSMLGLAGGSFHIEEFVTRTSIGTIILTPGFEVSGGFIMSANSVESVDNDSDATPKNNSYSFGAFSGVGGTEQDCYYGFDKNGLATTEVTSGRKAAVYMRGDEAAAPVLAERIEVTAIGATTVTLTQSVAAATAHHCIAVLFGVRAAVAPPGGGGEHKDFDGITSHAHWLRKLH